MSEMPDILVSICQVKRREIEELKRAGTQPLEQAVSRQTRPRGFKAALQAAGGVALIAEVKRASPSAGVIREDFDPVEIACAYERGGATCISVLTDRQFFQGDAAFLAQIRDAVSLPLLRKDFILDDIQVLEARAFGADAYLLIAAALDPARLRDLLGRGRDLGMDALVEVHDEQELDVALSAGADLIGINNRDLHTFEVSLETAQKLAPLVPRDVVVVAESGIKTRADVQRLKSHGVKAILVGETLMRAHDIEAATHEFSGH